MQASDLNHATQNKTKHGNYRRRQVNNSQASLWHVETEGDGAWCARLLHRGSATRRRTHGLRCHRFEGHESTGAASSSQQVIVGFEFKNLRHLWIGLNANWTFSSTSDVRSAPRVGRYVVDVMSFERIATTILQVKAFWIYKFILIFLLCMIFKCVISNHRINKATWKPLLVFVSTPCLHDWRNRQDGNTKQLVYAVDW